MSLFNEKLSVTHVITSAAASTVTLTLASTTGATNRYIHGFRGSGAGAAGTVKLTAGGTDIWYMSFFTSTGANCAFAVPVVTKASQAVTVVVVGGGSTYADMNYSAT